MSTPSINSLDVAYDNPLGGKAGIIVFVLLVTLSVTTVSIFCSELIVLPDSVKSIVLQSYLFTIIIGWYSFTICDDGVELLVVALMLGLPCLVLVGMIRMLHPLFFWLGLCLLSIFSVCEVVYRIKSKSVWKKILAGIYTVWLITGIITSLGGPRFLNYAQPALQFSGLHFLLDIRYLITACGVVIFVGKAMVDAFKEGTPIIPSLPPFAISSFAAQNGSLIGTIFRPIIILINATLFVVQKITNAAWQVVATVGTYLIRIGVNLAKYVLDIVLTGSIWISILRVLFTFMCIVIVTLLTRYIAPSIVSYFLKEWWPYNLSPGNFTELAVLVGSFILVLILLNSLCKVWDMVDKPLPKSAFAGSMLMVAWALSGIICFGLSRFDSFKFRGFHSLGFYTLIFLLFVGSVFVFQLFYHLYSQVQEEKRPPQPSMSTWAIGSLSIFLIASATTYWWVQRSAAAQAISQATKSSELEIKESKKLLREQTKKSFLERGKIEGKDVWQVARLINRTSNVIRCRISTTGGISWRSVTLQPGAEIKLSAQNNDVTVVWNSDLSSNTQSKQYNLITEAFYDHQPTSQEEESGPVNYFNLDSGSLINLYCEDC